MKSTLCIIKVVCLVLIALSVMKIAYSKQHEYMGNVLSVIDSSQPGLESHHSKRGGKSHFGNPEPPVFWNLGDVETINAELTKASKLSEDGMSSYVGDRQDTFDSKLSASLVGAA